MLEMYRVTRLGGKAVKEGIDTTKIGVRRSLENGGWRYEDIGDQTVTFWQIHRCQLVEGPKNDARN